MPTQSSQRSKKTRATPGLIGVELVDRLLERQHMGEVIHRNNASVMVHCSHGRERGVVYMANDVHVGTPELGKLGADHAAMAGDDNPLANVFCSDTFNRGVHPITKCLGTIAIDIGIPALGAL